MDHFVTTLAVIDSVGTTDLLISLVTIAFALIVAFSIHRDANSRRSSHELAWGFGAFLGGPIVWILYYFVRDAVGPSESM